MDRTVDSFLARGKAALWHTESEPTDCPVDGGEEDSTRALRQEDLRPRGRDGLLLLLTHAREARRLFTPWGLGSTASALLRRQRALEST